MTFQRAGVLPVLAVLAAGVGPASRMNSPVGGPNDGADHCWLFAEVVLVGADENTDREWAKRAEAATGRLKRLGWKKSAALLIVVAVRTGDDSTSKAWDHPALTDPCVIPLPGGGSMVAKAFDIKQNPADRLSADGRRVPSGGHGTVGRADGLGGAERGGDRGRGEGFAGRVDRQHLPDRHGGHVRRQPASRRRADHRPTLPVRHPQRGHPVPHAGLPDRRAVDELRSALKRTTVWTDNENVYRRGASYVTAWARGRLQAPGDIEATTDWLKFWQQADAKSVEGELRFAPRPDGPKSGPPRLEAVEQPSGVVPAWAAERP